MSNSDDVHQYEARLARDPSSQAFAALAEAYRRAGRVEEAVVLCRDGLRRFPGYTTTRLVLARALLDLGQAAEASVEIDQFLAAEPDHEPALRLAVECRLRQADPRAALTLVRRVMVLDPHDRGTQGLARGLEAAVGRGAEPTAGGLWPLLVDNTFATVAFGELCQAQGLTEEATAVFARIVDQHPTEAVARERLAELGRPRGPGRRSRG